MKRFLSLALSLVLLAGCAPSYQADKSAQLPQPPTQSQPAPQPQPEPEPEPEPEPVVSHLMVAGDIMSHMPLTNDCYVKETDSYDYTHVMENAARQLQLADWAVGNLETTLAGGPEYSGYPRFNAPDELAYNAKEAGFDLLCTTNNHCRDKGMAGLYRTLDVLDEAGVPHVGTYRSQEERDANHGIYVADVGGISVAFLAYTYGLNGFKLDNDKTFAANIFNTDYYTTVSNPNYDLLREDLAAARALDTDLIAVITHWGIEYRTKQNSHQEELAKFLVEQGADLVLGGHPHVLEPYDTITVTGEDGQERQGFVIYSLGNFISNQNFEDHRKDLATKTTAILDLELTKDPEGNTSLTDVRYTPYYMVHRNNRPVGERRILVDVNQAIADYEAGNGGIVDARIYKQLQEARDLCHEVLGPDGDRPSE
ncbi:CapA family protein [Colidextribacter sp. OB.20]|uniref:CapA family protein n=1 Tax=Colidextribacter sp. OB.20 TaxID=2304568 RepID=UPI00136C5E63|nr:CapA family protein [Colidextribacter sp. OB.20]NBI09334.1 CapA family protein [Colidextribacter sp. OB.20]